MKKGQKKSKDKEVNLPPSEEEDGIAPEHEEPIAPLVEEAPPPAPLNLFSSGQVRAARFAPLDSFLSSPKPLKPPMGSQRRTW